MRLFFLRFTLILVSSFLAVGCLELYLRKTNPISIVHLNLHEEFAPTNDDTIYEPIPNKTFNADGLRNEKEYTREKSEHVYRIALIGDSLAFGLGLSVDERFATLLEDSLNASTTGSMRYEVLNFGVPGYGISQIMAHFKKNGVKYHPDMVLYWHWFDDAYVSDPGWASSRDNMLLKFLPYLFSRETKQTGIWNVFRTQLYTSQILSHTIQYLRSRSETYLVTKNFPTYKRIASAEVLSRYTSYKQRYLSKEFRDLDCCDKYFQAFADIHNFLYWNYHMKEFSQMCAAGQFACTLLITPVLYSYRASEYNWSALNSLIADIATIYHIDVVDTVSQLAKYDSTAMKLFPDDSEHPNAAGNRYISDLMREYILSTKKR